MSEQSRRVIVVPVSEIPDFEWDAEGKSVSLDLAYERDAITIVLSMQAALLEKLRAGIDRALADRPKPTNPVR
jgi:hypothetical protein